MWRISQTYNGYETLARFMSMPHLLALPAILNCRITDLLPDSVVTDYDKERAADPPLREIQENWKDLPAFLQDGITGMVRHAVKEFKSSTKRKELD